MIKIHRYLLVMLLCVFSTAQAILDIEVTQAMDAPKPIAVVPFAGEGSLSTQLTDIIRQDLKRSGEFKLLPTQSMAQKPSSVSEVSIDYWRQIKMDALVIGSVQPLPDNKFKVQYQLFDVYAQANPGTPVMGETFTVSGSALRGLAHHIADQIYERLTGVSGAFSTKIAYVNVLWKNNKIVEYRLEIADSDGYNPKPLLTSKEPIMSPAWSPDGKQLAYVSFENYRSQIYVADIATGQRRLISKKPGINGSPAFSPDGDKLAIVLSNQSTPKLYVVNLKNDMMEKITEGPSIDTEPEWSPDGKSLYYTSNRGGKPQIYRVDLDSKKIDRITFEGDYNARPVLTSDGRYMIMIHRFGGRFHIAAQDLKSGQVLVLTETQLDQSPSLAPNDRMVIYSTLQGGKRALSAVSIDGRVKLKIPTNEGEVQDPAWSPSM
jgi:TolB protein